MLSLIHLAGQNLRGARDDLDPSLLNNLDIVIGNLDSFEARVEKICKKKKIIEF